MNKNSNIIISIFLLLGVLFPAISLATNSAGLVNGIWFDKTPVVAGIPIKVFSVVHNQRIQPLNGIVTLMVDGVAVGAKEVAVARESIMRVAITHTFSVGVHSVGIYFTADDGVESTMTALSARQITVKNTSKNTSTTNNEKSILKSDSGETGTSSITTQVSKKTHELTTVGKDFIAQLVGGGNTNKKTTARATSKATEATSTSFFQAIDTTRIRVAEAAKKYEKEQQKMLRTITDGATSTHKTAGFTTEKSKLKEYQIAAAGAAAVGFLFDKKWMFYLELVVLTLGIMHLVAVSMRAKAARRIREEEWE